MSNPVDILTGTSQRSLLMLEDIPEVCFTFWLILGCFGGSEKLQPDLKSQLPTVPKPDQIRKNPVVHGPESRTRIPLS